MLTKIGTMKPIRVSFRSVRGKIYVFFGFFVIDLLPELVRRWRSYQNAVFLTFDIHKRIPNHFFIHHVSKMKSIM